MPQRGDPVRHLPHVAPPIIPATDLGGVAVLKRGAVTLLSDAVGDVVPDARGLGLYVGDTRMLSCLVLLVGGVRPSVLRPDPGGAEHGTIVLTNPEQLRDPVDLGSIEIGAVTGELAVAVRA
jgi:hypothetical protein